MKLIIEDKKIIDVSTPLTEDMEVIPGLRNFKIEWLFTIDKGDLRNRSLITMETHLGTHVDAPKHFIKNGKSLDELPICNLMGMAQIITVPSKTIISQSFLKEIYDDEYIVLFKFGKERRDRTIDYFDKSAISFLFKKKVKTIGTDNGTVDSINTGIEIHTQILSKEILIVEGLRLERVDDGKFFFICLPLAIPGAEGSPARAIIFA
jgi:arylformamidase